MVLCLQFSNSFLGSQICQTTQHSRTRSTCPEATSRGSGCFHLPPSHLTEALRQPHLTPLQPNLNHICGSVFKNCISSCSLGLVACLGGLCLTKDRGWSLIYLLPHLLFGQSSRCRFVSWIPTLATSGSCPLVKHPCLSACLMLCSSFGTAQSFVCFLLPRSYLYYDLWMLIVLDTVFTLMVPALLFSPLSSLLPDHSIFSLQGELHLRSHPLVTCGYPGPKWLASLIKQKRRREKNERENISTRNCKLHNVSFLFSFVSWWVRIHDKGWITFRHHCLSCPFQSLTEDGCRGNNLSLVALFPLPFSYFPTISLTHWPERE